MAFKMMSRGFAAALTGAVLVGGAVSAQEDAEAAAAEDAAAAPPAIAGLYAAGPVFVDFMDDGHHVVFSPDAGVYVIGHYSVEDDVLTLDDRAGPGHCPDMIGLYAIEATEAGFTLGAVDDSCTDRVEEISGIGEFVRVERVPPGGEAPSDADAGDGE